MCMEMLKISKRRLVISKSELSTFYLLHGSGSLLTSQSRFIRFRVALMELTSCYLKIIIAINAIPVFIDSSRLFDPIEAIVLHVYMGLSVLRPDPLVKAAFSKTIDLFSKYYPELL